jgi:hypothetical protein
MAPVVWLHHFFANILYSCIYGLNIIVRFINHLPGATFQGLYINPVGVLLLYIAIILVLSGIIYKNKNLLAPGLAVLLSFLLLRNIDIYNSFNKKELQVLAVSPGHTVLTIKDRNHLYVFSDSSFMNDKQQLKYHINGYAWQNYISPSNIMPLNLEKIHTFSDDNIMIKPPLVGFYEGKLLMLHSQTRIQTMLSRPGTMIINAVALCDNPSISLDELYKKFHFKTVIGASGNNLRKMREWETECIENNIPFINLQNDNCFSLNI